MGTTNRSYNRHSRRAAMSNSAVKSRKLQRERQGRVSGKKKAEATSTFSFRKSFMYAVRGILGIFGYGRGGATIQKAYKHVSFTTPRHRSPWRSFKDLAIRKTRRQKRRRLIMTRGYA